ncbi:lytic murein transglycosylase [Rhodobacter sp. SGA-6-6]|uniref:lytic murein transglycosylase n=1 Tax=Rhodobacter sp. SGA-6-6 TaxID=2710882 RepID=UPI0013EAE8BF|nr:peptidoglycan-binding protein [Rhodobacter sp. SGA-6-6]NGM45721.1 lytic murein transglycosylase [Rhodobacter sp. SGA-6-6]
MRAALLTLALAATPAAAAPCGGDFAAFLDAMAAEALAQGLPPDAVKTFFTDARQDQRVLRSDRAQGVFRKTFLDFSRALISQNRLATAKAKSAELDGILARAEAEYGIPRGILLAFWAFETDFGQFQGDFNTRNALLTLAHDCRRPELFQPQVLAAIALHAAGDFPLDTTGAWAGEIGMVQMLPRDILDRGVDGDGDGHVRLKSSAADALLSGAALLRHHGWRAEEPWLTEVAVPEGFDWSLSGLHTEQPVESWAALGVAPRSGTLPAGLPATLIAPQGRKGPVFLAYPNFRVLFEWNQSFTYVLTTAYFATRIEGAAAYAAGNPDPALSPEQMEELQRKLQALGHDVGKIDGILGAGTRDAVQKEQRRLGLPADAWPTAELLDAL